MHTYTCQATFVKHARREYSQLLIYTCTSCTSLYNIYNLQSQTKWSNVIAHVFLLCMTWLYSRTSPYRHLSNIDTSLIRTVHLVPGKCPYILCKNNLLLYGPSIIQTTDTKSQPQWENSYRLNLFIMDTPMMTVLIQHDFLFVVTYQSLINCLIVYTIRVSFVFNQ